MNSLLPNCCHLALCAHRSCSAQKYTVTQCLVYKSKECEPVIEGMCSNYSTCVKNENNRSNDDEGVCFLPAGAIVGGVFGVLFGLAMLLAMSHCCRRCNVMRAMNINSDSKDMNVTALRVPPPCQRRQMRPGPKFSSAHHPTKASTDQRYT